MYWSASTLICASMASSERPSAISMILVMTAEPATATATSLVLVLALTTTSLRHWATASTSAMFFSTTEFGGIGCTA